MVIDLAQRGLPQWGTWNEVLDDLSSPHPTPCENSHDCTFCLRNRYSRTSELPHEENNTFQMLRVRRMAMHSAIISNKASRSDQSANLDDTHPLILLAPDFWLPKISSRIGKKWSLNVLDLEKFGCHFPFMHVGYTLLAPLTVANSITTVSTLSNFLCCLNSSYTDVPYHNSTHAAMTAHLYNAALLMLGHLDSFTVLERATCIVAALGHDAGHFGKNNNFLALVGDPLAVIYPDSTLENFHAMITFNAILAEDNNIFATLNRDEMSELHKRLVELILATDLSRHFTALRAFFLQVSNNATERPMECQFSRSLALNCSCVVCRKPDFDPDKPSDDQLEEHYKIEIMKMTLKFADVGHASVDWTSHYEWSRRSLAEVYNMADEARHYNSDICARIDRKTHKDYPKKQQAFIRALAMPLGIVLSMSARNHRRMIRFERIIMSRMFDNEQKWDFASESFSEHFESLAKTFVGWSTEQIEELSKRLSALALEELSTEVSDSGNSTIDSSDGDSVNIVKRINELPCVVRMKQDLVDLTESRK